MSEALKTIIFAGVAFCVALIAVFTYPRQESFQAPSLQGKPLFKGFTDPEAATELKIVKFSEDLGQLAEFEVARDKKTGLWVIPSSSNYPADAENQMRDAATALIDLQVIGVASERAAEHELYGVIEPNKEKLDVSQKGVGLLIAVKNSKGKNLARLIIGKEVVATEGQRFVRIPGQDAVYVVKIDPDKFPTEFEKWIERDLLKLKAFDVQRVTLKDYSLLTTKTLTGQTALEKLARRFDADVHWDTEKGEWILDKLVEYPDGKPTETKLLDSEELNKQKLDDLKNALGDLKIVGVLRKPKGLGADLKAGTEIMDNNESLLSLVNRGFFPVRLGNGPPELLSANGEVIVGAKDGVEYILRFGEIARIDKTSEEGKVNRYMFVTVLRDESQFPPLQLEPLPGSDDQKEKDAKKDGAKADKKKDDTKKADAKPDEAKDAKKDDAKKDGVKKEDASGDKKAENGKGDEEDKTDLELQRERVRKENQRKKDEREEKLKKANKQVNELNARFADWYYVISEDEYKKIRIRRGDLIKEKESAKDKGFGVDALRKLEEEGLKKKSDQSDSTPSPLPSGLPGGPR